MLDVGVGSVALVSNASDAFRPPRSLAFLLFSARSPGRKTERSQCKNWVFSEKGVGISIWNILDFNQSKG
jgi:hypothetical protein